VADERPGCLREILSLRWKTSVDTAHQHLTHAVMTNLRQQEEFRAFRRQATKSLLLNDPPTNWYQAVQARAKEAAKTGELSIMADIRLRASSDVP
jgi:hypothetical protein